MDIKKNDFIEVNLKILLEYENIDDSHIIKAEIRFYNDNNEQIFIKEYNNGNYISYLNFVFLNEKILYNFEKDTKILNIIIEFQIFELKEIKKIYYISKNSDRIFIRHYGN